MKSIWAIAAACIAAAATAQAPTPEKLRARDLKSETELLAKWLPGIFDNHEQVVRQSGHGLMPLVDTPFQRRNTRIEKLPTEDGQLAFTLVATSGSADPQVVREEVLVATPDVAANAMRLKRYAGTSLPVSALKPLPAECDLLLEYRGAQFEGRLASPACDTGHGPSDYQMTVGPDHFWERDQSRNRRSGKLLWEMAPGAGFDWHKGARARPHTCNIFASPGGAMLDTQFLKTIHLHDQGGIADIAWPDGRTLSFTIHSRAFTAASERTYPIFRLHEKGNPVPIAYGYAVDGAPRFGLNLGWFYARCYDDRDIAPVDMLEAQPRPAG